MRLPYQAARKLLREFFSVVWWKACS